MMAGEDSTAGVTELVGHLFRRESGRLIAILTRRFGTQYLHLAEDVVQDALVRAMELWPLTGVPQNPSAWLLQTAKNRLLDHARRGAVWRDKQAELAPLMDACLQSALTAPPPLFEDEINDAQLRMMFVCCQPDLPTESQVALILKTLCGFGEREIAAAFLASETAVTKRLVRARQLLRQRRIEMDLSPDLALGSRLEAVRQALYLMFNEGYKASHGDLLLRADLCMEAIRLGELLAAQNVGATPETHALLALMNLNASRLPARIGDNGDLLLLEEQDRTRWDRRLIARGMQHLQAATGGDEITRYHIEAGIASCHALAPSFAATDWRQIRSLYDRLIEKENSPIVALNRAVAIAQTDGPTLGLAALNAIADRATLEKYHLFHAVAGELSLALGEHDKAALHFRKALDLAALPAERSLLARRLARCADATPARSAFVS